MTSLTQGSGEVRLALPWPDKGLSPNARLHWARKAKLTKAARHEAWVSTLTNRRRLGAITDGPVRLEVVFCPPDHRRRDRDNLIASMKAANDGIADALGVDDSRFVSTYSMGSPVKGGSVLVTISQMESEAERFKRLEPVMFAGMGKGTA